jgi:hypothetical protein
MSARLATPFDPVMRFTLPALLSCRSRRQRPLRRDWLRIADRLAAGLPPKAAALPEGGDETMVAGLLQREDFQALVEAAREWHDDPDEAARRKLVVMARQALARAMDWEDDPRAALFVLDEEARGRDPAATVAAAVLKRPRRAPAPTDGIRSRPPRRTRPAPHPRAVRSAGRAAWCRLHPASDRPLPRLRGERSGRRGHMRRCLR